MASAAVAPPDQSAEASHGINPWLIAASVMLATFMEVLDTAIASVALPYIAGSLSASTDEATWVLTSYLVANAIVLPASNWFSLRFGRKRFLMSCVAIFTAASFACGAAPTLAIMLLARVIQGAGGGALQPLSQAILLESFPPAKRGAAMAVFAFGVVVAPVLGPTLGGWLTDTYSWRYAFYINIPIGILALFMINRFIFDPPYISKAKVPPLDRYGFAALIIWRLPSGRPRQGSGRRLVRRHLDPLGRLLPDHLFHLLLLALLAQQRHHRRSQGPQRPQFSHRLRSHLLLRHRHLLHRHRLPLFYQELLGYTAFTAGLVVAPRGIGAICGMPIIGYLSNKVDPRWLLTFGFFTFGLTTLYFGNVTLDLSPTTLLLPILITGFGLSFVFVPISTAAYGTLDNKQIGNASGLFNLMRNVGGSIGISIAQTLLTRRSAVHQNEIIDSVPLTGQQFQNSIIATQQALSGYYGKANALLPAQSTLYEQVGRQAANWAFVDVFRWLSLLCFFCVGIVWFFKKVKPGKAPAGAH